MQSTTTLKIGITGHRNFTEAQCVSLKHIIKKAIENIIVYHENTFGSITEKIFSSSLAEGADGLFAQVAIKSFDCKLKIILPFEKEEYIKDFASQSSKDQFELLLKNEKVQEIIYLNTYNENERDKLYFEAGKKIADENEYILAVWDEEKAKGPGGTADVAMYTQEKRKDLLVINPYEKDMKINGAYLPEFANQPYKKFGQDEDDNIPGKFFIHHDSKAQKNRDHYKKIWFKCFNLGLIAAFLFAIVIAFQNLHPDIKLLFNITGLFCVLYIRKLVLKERKKTILSPGIFNA